MAKRVTLSFDEESEQAFRESRRRLSKVSVRTKSGQSFSGRADSVVPTRSTDQVRSKFVATTSQVIDRTQVDRILNTIDNLETASTVSELIGLLHW